MNEDIPTEFYDPVFTPEDTAFLASKGHTVLSSPVRPFSLPPLIAPSPSDTRSHSTPSS